MTLTTPFSPVHNSAGHYRRTVKIHGSKTPPPLSLRLTEEARGVPLGTYIKVTRLGDGTPIRLRGSGVSVEDKAALAKALALLGQSPMANKLNPRAHLADIGTLPPPLKPSRTWPAPSPAFRKSAACYCAPSARREARHDPERSPA